MKLLIITPDTCEKRRISAKYSWVKVYNMSVFTQFICFYRRRNKSFMEGMWLNACRINPAWGCWSWLTNILRNGWRMPAGGHWNIRQGPLWKISRPFSPPGRTNSLRSRSQRLPPNTVSPVALTIMTGGRSNADRDNDYIELTRSQVVNRWFIIRVKKQKRPAESICRSYIGEWIAG